LHHCVSHGRLMLCRAFLPGIRHQLRRQRQAGHLDPAFGEHPERHHGRVEFEFLTRFASFRLVIISSTDITNSARRIRHSAPMLPRKKLCPRAPRSSSLPEWWTSGQPHPATGRSLWRSRPQGSSWLCRIRWCPPCCGQVAEHEQPNAVQDRPPLITKLHDRRGIGQMNGAFGHVQPASSTGKPL
jgi:hypothetical protein